jgi:transcriptional regulator with XRE-family HTH domain
MGLDFERIKELREGRGLTQEEAAKLAGLGTRQRWNDLEAGRRLNIELDTLERIAKALGVKARDLLK